MNEILSLLKTFAQEEPNVTTDNTAVCESCGGNMNEQPAVISLSDILRLAGMDSMPSAQQPTEVPASADTCTCPHCGSAHSPVSEEQIEEGKQDRIQKARDLIDRACGLDACNPEELGDHRIDMIAQETGLKRGHVKSIANHMDDEDDIKETATRELTDADNKVLAMVKKQIREMEQALTTASSEDSRYYTDRLSDLHDMVKMIHGEEPLGLDTDVMDEVSDMYRSIGASMYESGSRVKEDDDGMGSAFMKAYETLLRNKQ